MIFRESGPKPTEQKQIHRTREQTDGCQSRGLGNGEMGAKVKENKRDDLPIIKYRCTGMSSATQGHSVNDIR